MIWVAACIFVTVIVSLLFIAGIIFWQARKDDVGIVFNAVGLFLCLAAGTVITTHVNNLQEIEQITNREKVENCLLYTSIFVGQKPGRSYVKLLYSNSLHLMVGALLSSRAIPN